MAEPWMKFFPSDWRSDPALRMCSMAARGLWIEIIALMHEAVPYGHLLVAGRSPTDAQLAVLVGAPSEQIPELLGELDAAGVFSRTREGVIYSRKMTRTAKKTAIARKNGKSGGNPTLCKEGNIKPSDKGKDKDRDNTQKPEARSQRSNIGANAPPSPPRVDLFDEFWQVYPKKVGKAAARRNFDRAVKAGADPGEIVAGARRYASSETVQRGFVKHPQGWLTDGRWSDEDASQPQQDGGRSSFLRKIASGEAKCA